MEDSLENMYEAICNLSTEVESHEARQALIELLDDFQFSSLESAQDVRALDIVLVTYFCLGPMLRNRMEHWSIKNHTFVFEMQSELF